MLLGRDDIPYICSMIIFLGKPISDGTIKLLDTEVQHCVKTLRKQIGDDIIIHDGEGNVYESQIITLSKKGVTAEIKESTYYERLSPLHLSVALTKNLDRIEWLVSKTVEIGVTDITFIKSQRSEKQYFRYERMNRIIESAFKQSLKYHMPILSESVVPFKESIKSADQYSHLLIPSYNPDNQNLIKTIDSVKSCHIMIGPEGDFTPEEVAFATEHGYTQVNLGQQRLRTETAGLYAISLIRAMMDKA
jgi:16S rRNA (uracil1498-N3)-methyltransferase